MVDMNLEIHLEKEKVLNIFLNSFLIYNIELGYITDWKFDVGLYEMTLINILGGLHLTNLLRYLNSYVNLSTQFLAHCV